MRPELLRRVTEGLARTTSRRRLFGRGAEVATGLLIGAAAGGVLGARRASAGVAGTACDFPDARPCPCNDCQSNGVCAKPCVFLTAGYASGCWVASGYTCCDCICPDVAGNGWCGCGADYHNNPAFCPN